MRSYTTNILPTDAAYYKISNAYFVGNHIQFSAGGAVSISLDETQLVTMTEYFRVAAFAVPPSDAYTGTLTLLIHAKSTSGKYFTHFCNLNMAQDEVFLEELEFIAKEYEFFTLTYHATEECTLLSWELCPEAGDDVQVVIDGVRQSLPRLLYDYNTTEITVAQSEQIIGMIHCYLIDGTDLQGHFLMNFTATERCTVHLRFYDSTMIELFSPVIHTVNNGYNTLEVPHSYLNKLRGTHSFYVTAQVTNGSLTIPIRGILYTIDGGYLAGRLLNPGMDVSDITLKQLNTDREPSEIWAIGIDSNKIIVKKRAYDLSKPDMAWTAMYVIGEGTTGAIEFDGNWVKRAGATAYTLETYSLPVIAFVDMDKILWVYQYGMDEDPIKIASGVTCISMVRGYKSNDFPDQDQGLILCWVQDGDVYYKQYAYFNGSYQWYPTEQLTQTGNILFVQVHRLNDYRIGIVTQDASENIWYITDRTYVSQAVPTEITQAFVMGMCDACAITKEEEASISFEAVPNVLYDSKEPQSDYSITFTYPVRVALHSTTPDMWKYHMLVTVNSKELYDDQYDFAIEGATLKIHLHEAVWGIVQVSWNEPGFIMYLDEIRHILITQASYSFTWNIWSELHQQQPTESMNASLQGTMAFEYIGIQNTTVEAGENINASLDGTAEFLYTPINKITHNSEDTIRASIEGTLTFAMMLVGEQPI